MIGVDLLAGAAVGYLIRKARRVSRRVDGHVDDALDASTDRVCELIEGALGRDPVLALLRNTTYLRVRLLHGALSCGFDLLWRQVGLLVLVWLSTPHQNPGALRAFYRA